MNWRPLHPADGMALAVAEFEALGLHELDFTAPRGGITFVKENHEVETNEPEQAEP